MANATEGQIITAIGHEGYIFDLPVKSVTAIKEGTLISQHTSGYVVPYSTAGGDHAVGVAQHDQDNTAGNDGDKRLRIETNRMYAFANGAGGDAFADTDKIGSVVFGTDDHTAAKTSSTGTRKPIGFFMGFEPDGKVRVFVSPMLARLYSSLGGLTDNPATADALRDDIVSKVA